MNYKLDYVKIALSVIDGELDYRTSDYYNPHEMMDLADLLEQFGVSEESLEKLRDFAAKMFER